MAKNKVPIGFNLDVFGTCWKLEPKFLAEPINNKYPKLGSIFDIGTKIGYKRFQIASL